MPKKQTESKKKPEISKPPSLEKTKPDLPINFCKILPKKKSLLISHYNFLTNSCIDFTWKALEVAGLNSSKYQGSLLPMKNGGMGDWVTTEAMRIAMEALQYHVQRGAGRK